jgi:hypothetical protein
MFGYKILFLPGALNNSAKQAQISFHLEYLGKLDFVSIYCNGLWLWFGILF